MGGAAYWFALRPAAQGGAEAGRGGGARADPGEPGGRPLPEGRDRPAADADAKEADGSKALDATIEEFSGLSDGEVTRPDVRAKLKEQLEKELEHRYEGEVMGVYFTDFVTQ